jgi:hypothetical protein
MLLLLVPGLENPSEAYGYYFETLSKIIPEMQSGTRQNNIKANFRLGSFPANKPYSCINNMANWV